MLKFIMPLLLLPFLYLPAFAPPGDVIPPFDPLLATIGGMETRGHPRPEWAVGKSGEVGRYQIKHGSAVHFGGFDEVKRKTNVPTRNPGELFNDRVNFQTALNILNDCRARYGLRSARRLIYCYGAGAYSAAYTHPGHREWSKKIATKFANRQFCLDFRFKLGRKLEC